MTPAQRRASDRAALQQARNVAANARMNRVEGRIDDLAGGTAAVTSINGRDGAVTLAAADVGLAQADNTPDAEKPVSSAQAAAFAQKQSLSARGAPNGYAALDADGRVPAAQLPPSGGSGGGGSAYGYMPQGW